MLFRVLDPNATRDHWDHMAATYDRAKDRNAAYYVALKAAFAAAVPLAFRGRVLDIGCGTGQVLASLRPIEGVGIDASPNMIAVAQREFAARLELTFAVMKGEVAAGLGQFDAVISADVFEHVPDWEAIMRAMTKACRPGGLIAISTPNPAWTFSLWLLERLKLKMPEGPHRFVHRRDIGRALAAQGCHSIRCTTHAWLPVALAGLGPRLSAAAEDLPLLRGLGVIQMVTALKLPPRS